MENDARGVDHTPQRELRSATEFVGYSEIE
jgi:hypothetical protein